MKFRTLAAATAMVGLLSGAAQAGQIVKLTNRLPRDGVIYGFLMTDGTVLYQGGNITDWYKLTPDAFGNYQKGTWSRVASLPAGYAPYATGGGVLPDGRLLLTGGEYVVDSTGTTLVFTLTTQSAIYDPTTNAWTLVNPLPSWIAVGDSPGTVRADGLFMMGLKLTNQTVVLDPGSLTWSTVLDPGKSDINAEEGFTLLPDGSILAADVTNAPNTERFIPSASPLQGQWITAGATPELLKFTWTTPPNNAPMPFMHNGMTYYYTPAGEIGPAILRPDGSVFQTGALETSPLLATAGHTAIYYPPASASSPGSWVSGPDFQTGDDAGDEFAVLLPNGNVLVEANTNGADNNDPGFQLHARRVARFLGIGMPAAPIVQEHNAAEAAAPAATNPCAPNPQQTYHLYEFDGTNLTITGDVLTCGNSLSLLGLPNGQTLVGGQALYTSSASTAPAPGWAPVVTQSPPIVLPGSTYTVMGKQFTGLSQAAAFGDEFPTPTNYPLVRITNITTGHVTYARTHGWSTSAVASGSTIVSTLFDVPKSVARGPSTLEVVANGIASAPVKVTVR